MGKSQVIGIDIGHHSIKAVALKPSKGTFNLVGYQEIRIEADIISDNHVLNYQKIVKKLKELRKSLPLFSQKVALAVPDNAVISKVLQIDSGLEGQEREFAIAQAFSHQSPFPVEDLSFDFVELGKSGMNQSLEGYQVYATKLDVVESRVSAVSKAGFKPVMLDVQAHGLVHVWQLASILYDRADWLLLDVGSTQSSVCMDFQNKAPFYKEIALGTQLINSTDELESKVHGDTERFIHGLVEKLQRNIQLLSSINGADIKGVWLSGGGASTPMLSEEISRRLNLRCELLNPLTLFGTQKLKKCADLSASHAFATATGLALRGLDWMERSHVA